jgi:hypothetical protein
LTSNENCSKKERYFLFLNLLTVNGINEEYHTVEGGQEENAKPNHPISGSFNVEKNPKRQEQR